MNFAGVAHHQRRIFKLFLIFNSNLRLVDYITKEPNFWTSEYHFIAVSKYLTLFCIAFLEVKKGKVTGCHDNSQIKVSRSVLQDHMASYYLTTERVGWNPRTKKSYCLESRLPDVKWSILLHFSADYNQKAESPKLFEHSLRTLSKLETCSVQL